MIFDNGGVNWATFDVECNTNGDWFASRNRFDEFGFFPELLSALCAHWSMGPRDPRLPELDPRHFRDLFANTYTLPGWLAGTLKSGGAYSKFQGTGAEAMAIASRAVFEIVEDRFEEVTVYRSHAPWSDWFFDIAWDSTTVIIDRSKCRIHTLAMTDTD